MDQSLRALEIEQIITGPLADAGIEVVDLMYRREGGSVILRVFIDLAGGVTLEDCSRVTKLIKQMEAMEVIDYDYLEVSSPGTDRILKKEADFIRFAGHEVHVKCKPPYLGKRNYTGKLESWAKDGISIITEDKQAVTVPSELITSVRLRPQE